MNHQKLEEIQENREIGELVREIVEKGFRLSLELENGKPVAWLAFQGMHARIITDKKATISETLASIVDTLRTERGEPTLAEETEKLLQQDKAHTDAPPVEVGPDACCGCGSRKPLILERTIKLEIPWSTGQPQLDRVWGLLGIEGLPNAGEIGTCPDCGRNYTFNPA